jgi:hypothetical protein
MRRFEGLGALLFPRARRSRAGVVAVLAIVAGTLIGATGAAAGPAVTETFATPYTFDDPCTGEVFEGTGTTHFVMSESLSTTGAIWSHVEVRIDGLQAVGLTSQKRYIAQDTFDHEFVFTRASEETFNITAHFVRVGEDGTLLLGDDFYAYLRAHITADANGMVTAFRIDTNDDTPPCQ